jgi:hypothetical protein
VVKVVKVVTMVKVCEDGVKVAKVVKARLWYER